MSEHTLRSYTAFLNSIHSRKPLLSITKSLHTEQCHNYHYYIVQCVTRAQLRTVADTPMTVTN